MMYSTNFATAIRVGGNVLRENGDEVQLPFGSEYSIRLKNLNTVRAMVKVDIDGHDVTDGRWLILEPNTSFDLERSIRDGNMSLGNKFKFIERTSAVENYRGIGSEDGLIRVEYKFEIPQYRPSYRPSFFRSPDSSYMKGARSMRSFNSGGISGQSIGSTLGDVNYTSSGSIPSASNCVNTSTTTTGGIGEGITFSKLAPDESERSCNFMSMEDLDNDSGITVEGSISNQQFAHGDWFPTESSAHVLVFRLRGQHGKLKVGHPVTVKTQLHCSICGRNNKHNNKFCGGCGASLTIVGAGDRIIA